MKKQNTKLKRESQGLCVQKRRDIRSAFAQRARADIVVQNPRNGKATGVQVKTQRRIRKHIEKDYFRVRPAIPARIDEEKEFEVPFVLVYYDETCDRTRCFVVPKEDMLNLCKQYWDWYQRNVNHRKPSYGHKKGHLSIAIWQLHVYEDRWENLGIDLPSIVQEG